MVVNGSIEQEFVSSAFVTTPNYGEILV